MKGEKMAILTRKGYTDILRRIFETGGLTPDMESDLTRLKDDFDEREGMLRRYGEVYDGEDREEYEYLPIETDWERKYNEMDSRYHELQNRYVERFMGKSKNTLEEEDRSFKDKLDDDTDILEEEEESVDVMDLFK